MEGADGLYKKSPNIIWLSKELIKICDNYWAENEFEVILKEYIHHVAKTDKLIENNGRDINRSIRQIIGKRRVNLINIILTGF